MPFGDLSVIKAQLGINPSDTQEDTALTLLINQCSTFIETYCNKTFLTGTYTEVYSGNGLVELPLNQRPVVSTGLVVHENETAYWGSQAPAWPSTALLVYGTDYALEIDQPDGITSKCGILYKISGAWQIPLDFMPGVISNFVGPGVGNIQVTYTAGYAAVPQDVQMALFMQIAAIRNSKNYGQLIRTESRGDGAGSASYSLSAEGKFGAMPREVQSLLAGYRNVAIF